MTTLTRSELQVRPVAGKIGAEISGVALSGDLDSHSIESIRAAILAHKVVFFRGQSHLDEAAQVEFASRLGQVTTAHPTVPGFETNAHVLDLDSSRTGGGRANNWHTDVTFVHRPPSFSVLRSVVIPPSGGDTVWANTATAYADLPAELRELADRLWAVHSNDFDYAALGDDLDANNDARAQYQAVFSSVAHETVHPVVRVHPETGERALLLGGFVRNFRGFGKTESNTIYRLFQDRITGLENSVRWNWTAGDVVIWDNRATQHYAVADYGDQPRIVRRVTIAGEVPISVDGQSSESRSGDAAAYYEAA
jgi:taurine dioxygenase